MKKSLITAACSMIAVGAFAQGTVFMYNSNNILDPSGAPLGPASGGTDWAELVVNGTPIAATISQVNLGGFLGAGGAGIPVPGITAGTQVSYVVDAWDATAAGLTFAQAQAALGGTWGVSAANNYTLGGGSPPVAPGALSFASFALTTNVPEPTTLTLGALGLGALLIRRRK
jgi:hypothetical protein